MAKQKNVEVHMDKRAADDRRNNGGERRQQGFAIAVERRDSERRKTPRRRQIDPTTCERDYSDDEIEFMHALDAYKRTSGRMFPTCSEILEVIRNLGYARTTPAASQTPASPVIAPIIAITEFGSPANA